MKRAGTAVRRERVRAAVARLLLIALTLGHPLVARAQTARPAAPADLQLRDANFSWDQGLLRANFSFSDILDERVKHILENGTANTIAMRAYVFREGETNPVLLVVQTCTVTYKLWDSAYTVEIENASGASQQAVVNVQGVARLCAQVQDFPIASRASLRAGVPHFLGVIVDVNPVSDAVRTQMRSWMRRPLGSADVGGGDALFSGLVLLFFRDVGGSDANRQFRTRTFIP